MTQIAMLLNFQKALAKRGVSVSEDRAETRFGETNGITLFEVALAHGGFAIEDDSGGEIIVGIRGGLSFFSHTAPDFWAGQAQRIGVSRTIRSWCVVGKGNQPHDLRRTPEENNSALPGMGKREGV